MAEQQPKRVFDFYPLEDRVLLSGTGADGMQGLDAAADVDVDLADALLAQLADAEGMAVDQAPANAPQNDPTADEQTAEDASPDDASAEESSQHDAQDAVDTPLSFDPAQPLEVIFVDAGVEDADQLLDGLRSDDDGRTQWLVIEISADEDGVQRISDTLNQLSGVDAVHLLSHGDGQGIQLGNTRLDVETAGGYAGQIAGWQGSLDSDADLLIYGCDLAGSEEGRELIDSLATLTDLDVAASDDVTGHADLGGDWDLEYSVGSVGTELAFSYDAIDAWEHTLADPPGFVTTTFQEGVDSYSGTIDTYVTSSNEGNHGGATTLEVDSTGDGTPTHQTLIRFDDLFGSDAGQMPANVYITSASLSVNVDNPSSAGANIELHAMLNSWSDSATWNSLSGGVSTNDSEAASVADASVADPTATGVISIGGLADRVQSWQDRASSNYGWMIESDNSDGWDIDSSESANKPTLSVTYITPGSQASTAHTLVVDTVNDVLDGDATSIDALLADKGADGKISLREAIWAANNTTNSDASTPDQIEFAIGSGAQTILVGAGGLPTLTDAVVLDATTQPGYSGTPLITLDGTNATSATGGITLRTNDSTVSGFIVQNFVDEGLEIDGTTGFGDNNIFENNWVGISAAGAAAGNADNGILVTGDADDNIIRNNIIGASGSNGITISNDDSDSNWVYGNTIGLAADGSTVRANSGHGIAILDAGANNLIGSDADGNNDTLERNIISGNAASGIFLSGATTTQTTIAGNYVGLDASGTSAIGNGDHGILVYSSDNTIGGTSAAARNVISGNADDGIRFDSVASGNTVLGNYIGTNAAGDAAIGNGDDGVSVMASTTDNIIGGSVAGAGNVISGNDATAVYLEGADTIVQGNYLGTDASGTADLGNTKVSTGEGSIRVWNATGATIGGTGAGEGNVIAFGGGDGVLLQGASTGIMILGNSIHSHAGLAIDLGDDGVTANDGEFDDTPDQDGGANNLQNFPVLSAAYAGATPTITGSLKTTPSRTFRIEFFANASADASGYGEGQRYLGFVEVTTNGTGDATIATTLSNQVITGETISATATDLTTNETSEFGLNVTATNSAPVLDAVQSPVLSSQMEDAGPPSGTVGTLVSSLVDFASPAGQVDNVSDSNPAPSLGIAITAANTTNGTWYYSTDAGSNWNALGAVSDANARLLAADANTRIYFHSDANYNGTTADAITLRAWDQSTGTNGDLADTSTSGGSTAFSTATDTAGLTVTAVNDAPEMTPLTPTYNAVEDGASYANTVAAFLGSTVSDVDAGAVEGAAITALNGNGATIDYSLDGGTTWLQFDAVSESNALLLRATDRLRFTPATDNGGSISIEYRAWDQTTGTAGNTADTTSNGGSTAFSTASDSITVNTTSVNDAPIAVDDHHGLTFDGVDDFVNLGSDASLEFTSTMTMEVWARPTAYPASSSVILNKEGEYEIGISDTGSLMWAFSNTDPAWNWHDTGHILQLNEWAHISVSYDNGTVNTYVNGHNIETYNGSGTIGDAHATLDDFRVGGRQNNPAGNYFTGDIDEVRLWSTARTQSQILNNLDVALTGAETGLAGYWNFNEGSGTVANDLTSNANHGTLTDEATTGAPIWTGFATDQDSSLTIAAGSGVLSNDVDVEGDTLTVSQVQGSAANVGSSIRIGSGALVTVNANGSFDYAPDGAFNHLAAGETATDTFTYTVSDGNGGTDTATVSITVTGTDDAPTIVADSDLDDAANEVIDFQGDDDTISLSGLPLNTADGTDVTVEFWMNWDGTDNVMPFGFDNYDLWLSSGYFGFNTGGGDLYGISSAGLETGWHHVTAVFRNGSVVDSRLIIDGVEQSLSQQLNSPNNGNATATSNAQISGWNANSSYKFDGQIDQVRIWNGGRSETQVREAMFTELSGPQTGLVASYSFTGATSGAGGVTDDSGNGHHGTISGMTAANVITGSGFDALGDQTVNEDDLVTLQVSAFDPENAALTYTWTQTSGPAVTLSDANAEKPTFTALNQDADYQLVFTVDASDGSLTTTETVTINVQSVNDAPSGADNTLSTAEDTDLAFTAADFGFADDAENHNFNAVRITTQTAAGSIYLDADGDGAIDGGETVVAGTYVDIADINAGRLKYKPLADDNGAGYAQFTFQVQDDGGTGGGGQDTDQSANTMVIDVTAVNDAPVFSGLDATPTYVEDGPAVVMDADASLFDEELSGADNFNGSRIYIFREGSVSADDLWGFSDGNGITLSGSTLVKNGQTIASFDTTTTAGMLLVEFTSANGETPTQSDVNSVVRQLTYANSSDTPPASISARWYFLDMNVGDQGSGGNLNASTLMTINITATNDDPTNAGSLPSDITVSEDVSGDVDLSAIDLSDVDHGGSDLTVTLTTSTGGDLSASDGGGVTVGGSGTGTVTLTGTQDELNTFLNTASNVQYLHSTANLNGNDADTIQVQVTDNGNTGSGGGGQIDLGTVNVDISAVNDAPVNTVPGTQTIAEETTTAIGGVSIGDVDAASGNLTTRLQVSNGVINVSLSGAATISSGTNGTGDLTIQGSVADINATLASLTYTGNTDVVGVAADTLTVTTNDGGNTGSGGALQDVDTVQIDVTGSNDAPVAASIEGTAVDYTENDGAVTITSTIAFSDVDDTNIESAVVEISGNYANGEDVLTFVDQNGITGVWNNGTLTLTGSATLAEYETAIRSITYENTSDDPSAATRTISFTVNDGDVDSNTLTRDIDFTATNDDPTNAGSLPSDITVSEDVASNVDLSAINLSDVDHGGSDLTVTLTTSTGGNLSASDGGGVTVGGSGTGTVTLTGTQDELNTFLNTASNVQYLHSTANLNGNDADTIQGQVTDNGNTGSGGGGQIDLGTVNVDISAVNDAPVNTVPGTQSVAEETTTVIGGVSIGDVDAASGNLTTRLQVSNGVMNVSLSGAATISAGTNGTGDLTIQGSVADINATLASLTYTGDTDVVGVAADTLTVTTGDGGNTGSGGTLQDVDTVQIDITGSNDAPVAASIEGTAIDYTENDGTVAITSTIAFSDVDDTNIESAVVEISGNYANGEDVLTFVDQNGITGSWNNGTLTLSGSATLAEYETAIRSITYENTSDDPSAATRTISFTVNDGDVDSNTVTRDIDFTATNDDPTNSGSLPSDITVTEDVASNVDLSAIDLSDVDHGGSDLTVTLTTSTGGNLSASDGGGVTVGGSGTGTVTLTGTQDELNTFLNTASNVQYLHSTANLNGNDADTIQVQVTDNGNTGSGGGGQIDLGTVNVDISAVNDAPVNTVPGTQSVAEETTTAIGGVSIGDVDAASGNLTTRLQVSNGVMNVSLSGAATISSGTNGTGDLTIQGSVADINATLASLTYTGDTDVVGVAADTLTVTTNDGGNTGSGGALQDVDTVQIDITGSNDAPVASSIEGTAVDYTENDGAVAITSTIAFSDVDDTNIESAVVEISGNYANGEDVLTFVDQNGITGSWNNGTLTLSGSATLAEYETAIRSITYENTSDDPSAATRTISFTVNDGDVDSNTVTRDIDFTATNDDPTNSGSLPSDITVTEDVASNVDLSAIDLSDVDHGGSDLTVTLTTSTGGNLSASSGGGVTVGGSGTGTVTLTGTQDELNTFLNTASNVQYLHSTANLNGNDADTIQVQVTDNGNTGSGGGGQIDLGTVNVDISAVNDAPVNTVPGTQTVAEETTTAIGGVSIGDVDAASGNLTTRLQVSNGVMNVSLSGAATISSGTNGTGDLTIQGSVADINATLASLTYTGDTDVVGVAADTLTVTTGDGGNTGSGGALQDVDTVQIDITGSNDAPVASSIEGTAVDYTENDGAVAITSTIAFSDVDDTDIESAVVEISGNYANGEDLLTFVDQNGITGTWNNGTLTLSGSATLAQYETAIRSITYENTSDDPSAATRTISFTVNDGDVDSNTVTRNIDFTATNDDPTNAGSLPSDITVTEDAASNVDLSAINLSDVDHGGSDLTISLTTSTGGNLSASSGGGVTVGGSGTGTVTLSGTQDELNTFLNTASNVQYLHSTLNLNGNDADTIQVQVTDNGNTGSGGGGQIDLGTVNVDISAVNDAPVNTVPGTQTIAEETTTAIGGVSIGDVDAASGNLTTRLQVSNGVVSVTLSGAATVSSGTNGTGDLTIQGSVADINATLASLTYTGNTDVVGVAADTLTVTTGDGGNTGSGGALQDVDTVQIDITGSNDAPVASSIEGTAVDYTENDGAVAITSTIAFSDVDDTDIESAVVEISGNYANGEDVLTFIDQNGITGSWNNGTLTLSGSATLAQYETAIRSITYENTSDDPSAATRTISFTVNDGDVDSNTVTRNIDFTATNDDPTNAGSLPSDITVTEDAASNVDLSAINLSDVDHGGSDLTISLTTSTGGNLSASSGGGVTVGGSGTGTVTLSGTQDELNTFLNTASNVQYLHSTLNLNGNDADTIQVQVTDNGNTGSGGGGQIDLGTVNVDISAVNDAPVNTVPGTQTIAEETTTAIGGVSIGDVDAASGNLTTRLQVSNGVVSVTLSGAATISSGTNGTGDLTIQGSVADINATLASLTYTGNTDVVGVAADTLTVTTGDGGNTGSGGALQDVDTIQIDITGSNDAPVAASIEGTAIDYTENDGAVAITSTIAFSDVDDTDIESAVVEISGNYANGEDVLTFIDQNGITGSWNNGTLTLSGSATLGEYETAIRSITYENTSDDPSAATRTISFTVNDGDVDSNTVTRNIDFTATNDDPTNAGSLPSDITVTEDAASNVDLSAINLSDVDHGGSDLTVTLTTSTGGNLSASDGGGVTVGGSGTGTVTLTGTQDELNTFLNTASNVQYLHSTTNLNGNDADTIQVQVTDNGNTGSGGGGQIDLGTVNVDISAVNDAPVNTVPGTQTIAEETTTAIGGVSIGDVDAASGNLTTRLQVGNGVVSVTLSGGATISSGTNGTGDLTIQGSVADINATLASLTYTGNTDVVGVAADTLTVITNDGGNTGSGGALQDVATVQIDIAGSNDAPVAASIEGTAVDYTENDGAVAITSTITFSDVDDTNIESAVVEISGNYANGEDVLTFIDQNGITGSWNNGTLTLSGSATLAQYETAIRSITYENNSDDPSAATRTISFTVNDGDVDSNTLTRNIDFTATNDDPTNAGSLPSDITVGEDVASNVDLSAIDLSDVDHGGSDLTVTLTTSTGGNLSASDGGGVTVGGSGTGTVTLTGTQDELNTFLNAASNVQYLHSTLNLNGNDADTIQVQVTDNGNTGSGGGGQIDLGTVNVDISAVNDAPVNTVPGTQTVAEETTTAIGGVSIGDVDAASGNLTTRLQVSNGVMNVSLSGTATISSGTNGTGDLTIQGSVADINATLASLTYTGNTDVVGVAADTLTVTTGDGGNTGSGGALQDVDTVQIDITGSNDAPVASSIEGTAVDYTENDGAVAITSTIAFSDVDDTDIESAVVEISGNYANGEDLLTFVDQNGITGSWNNGTLTLSGSATLAEYETAIRSITYENTSDDPSAATRTISFTVNDGDVDSNTLTRDLDFTATNDDPTNAGSLPSDITVSEDVASNVDLSAIDLSDVDHGGSDLTVTLTTSTGGNLSASDGGGVTVGGSGTGTVTLTGTQDELNTFLNTASNVQYLHSTANLNGNDADTIQVQVTDNGNTGSGGGGQIDLGTVNVDINAVNDAPVNTVPGTQTVAEETTTVIGGVSIGDVDAASGNLTTRLQVSNGVVNVSLSGAATISSGTNGTGDLTIQGSVADINATLASLTYTGNTDVVGVAADTLTVTTGDGGNTGSGGALQDVDTVQIDITTINDAPVASSIEGTAVDYTENEGAVTITSTIAFSDVDDTNIESAIVEISGNYAAGEDVLTFVDQNGITGTWNNGTLTLTGSATLAEYETAIRSITYGNTSDDPSAATRTISFTVNDGDVDSNTLTRDIDFTATNDDPTNAGSLPSDITVTEDAASNVDLSAIDLSDVDHQGSDLTVTLTTSTGGNLTAAGSGGVTVGGSGTGTVTLTGTQDELNTFLNTASNVQYLHSTANLNGNDADTIQVQVTDNGNTGSGGGGQIDLGTVNVDISAVNDAPVNTVPGTQSVAEETTTAIGGVSIGDVDAASGNLTTRLQVSNGVINVSLSGGATISSGTNGTGDLTIQGSVADINATLASLTYTGDTDVVGVAADTLTVTTGDGGNTGSGGSLQDVDTVQIDITGSNDAPVSASIEGTAVDYTENDGAVAITSTITFSDVDDTNIESAVVEISGNYANGEDLLTFVDQNGITGSWNNGTLTLSGSATLAQYETAIRSITYENTSDDPSAATRTISFTVNDGDVDSNTVTRDIDFTATNDDPTNSGSLPSDITVSEDVSSNVDLSAINLSDVDHGGSDLTISLTTSTGGNLSASSGGGVTVGGSGTGTVTLSGTQDELNTFLNTASNVQYLHSTANLNGNDADTIQVQVTDNGNTGSGGGGQIDLGTVNVDISAVNDAPVNTVPGTQTVAEETTTAIAGVSIGDVDASAGNLTTRLQVSNGVVNVTLSGAATVSSGTNGTGDLTIQGSVADINATLASLTYTGDTDVVGVAADTLTVTTGDGGNTGSGGALQDVDTVQIDITGSNDAPVAASIEGIAIDYTENDGAVAITSTITFSDVDDTDIESAVVEISGNYANGEDILTFVDQNGITGTWNNGTLTLTGSATLAEYETAIRSITYENTSDDPSAATRTISFTVNDGDVDSNTLTRDIDITVVNDSPNLDHNLGATVLEGGQVVIDDSMLEVGDVDDTNSELTFTVVTNPAHGHLAMAGSPSTPVTQFTQDDLDQGRVIYVHDGSESTADSFEFSLADGGEDGATTIDRTFQIHITPVNESPTSLDPPTFTIDETTDTSGGIALGTLTTVDPDAGDHFTYAIVGGSDAAVFSIGGSGHDQLVMDDGYLPVGGQTVYDVILRTTDSGGLYIEQAVTVLVNDINQAPVAGDDAFDTLIGEALILDAEDLLDNDTDADGHALFVQIVSQPTHGTISVDANGDLVYTPQQGYFGADQFSYAAHDGIVAGNPATVSINVEVYVSSGTSSNVVESEPSGSTDGQQSAPESPPESASQPDTGNGSSSAPGPVGSGAIPAGITPETAPRTRSLETNDTFSEQEHDSSSRPQRELSGVSLEDRDEDSSQGRILAGLSVTSARLPLSALEIQQFEQILQQDIAQAIVWHRWEELLQEDQQEATAIVIGSVGVTAGLVSLGYVAWILRGGAFFAASLSSLPAWRMLDPATFLDAYRRRGSQNDEAERIFDDK